MLQFYYTLYTWEAEDFSHEFSTIISHCAYQMYTGNGGVYTSLEDEELAQLWYGTLYLLPSDCSFDDLRDCMELMAEVLGYTEEQQQCVSAAFDNAGISQYYDESITICVKENSGDNYMDYVLQISGTYNTWLGTKTYFECFYPEDNGEIYLQLKEGDYTITVLKDDESQNIEQKSIVVDKGVGANSIVFYTDIYTSYGLDNAEEDLESELQPEETETTAVEVDYSLYTQDSEIETIMLGENSYYDNKGFLYDIDGNGVDELVMLYTTDKVYEGTSTFPTLVTSVYTIQDGVVSCLIYEEVLYTQAGGPYGYVAVVEKDSQNYFVVFREDGETGPGAIRYCVWKRYKIAESFSVQTVMMEEEIRCDITYVDDDCTVITGTGEIGNEVVDYGDYCAYIDGYSIVRKCAEYSEDDGIELAELYYELGGANNQISDVSITTETTFNDETRIKRVTLVNDYLFEKYLEIPVFIESTGGYAKINTFFENMVSSEFSINNESLIYNLQLVEEYPTELESYYQDICTATIGEENAKYVSVRLSYTWFMGGVYNSWADGYTFDVNTGELLVISDVLSESEDEIIDEIYKELEILEKEYGEGSFWWEQIENYDVNDYDFYVINDVMYIHFDVYELAPGVYGDFFITLPFDIQY